ncbi:MAG: hypoxanthine phosphoribosyltransferase [Thermoanaerobaculia bacterium]
MVTTKKTRRPQVLIDQAAIERRVGELAAEISRDFADATEMTAIGILKGSVFFFTDLLKRIDLPMAIDFFQTSSYGSGSVPGEVRIKRDIDLSIRGRDVLLVEDIVDTGWTVRTILDLFRFRGARRVKLATLLDKHARRETEVPIDYVGFRIEPRFVVGYGLDHDERWRNLPYIGVMD